jgi:hypothetical protein
MSQKNSEKNQKNHIPKGLYYVIPSQVYDDERLEDSEKMLYMLVSGLAFSEGYCYASDKYLAERRNMCISAIKKGLKQLECLGYLKRETRKIGTIWERKIFITHSKIENVQKKFTKGNTVPFEGACSGEKKVKPSSTPKTEACRKGQNEPLQALALLVTQAIEQHSKSPFPEICSIKFSTSNIIRIKRIGQTATSINLYDYREEELRDYLTSLRRGSERSEQVSEANSCENPPALK